MRFLVKMAQNILRDFTNAHWMQERFLILRGTKLLFILLSLNALKLRTNIVIVHFELKYFFITNGISDHISVQLLAKHAARGFSTQGVFRENWRTGKAKLVVLFEFFLQVFLRFTELASMTLIKNKDNLLVVDS